MQGISALERALMALGEVVLVIVVFVLGCYVLYKAAEGLDDES